MKEVRVLVIGMYDKLGGTETYLMNYYRNIERHKVQLDFINIYNKLYFEEEILSLGGRIHKITHFKKNPIEYIKGLRRVIRKNNYSIVHINMLSAANILPLIVAKISGVKFIIAHSHNSNTPKILIKRILHNINKKLISNLATDFFACSELAGQWMFTNEIVENNKLVIIKNAIDAEKFIYNDNKHLEFRQKIGIDKDKFLIGHIGAFREQKNHVFLLNVFKKIKELNSDAVLVLIGDGELKENLIKQAIRLNIYEDIVFLGLIDDVDNYLQAMDVFLFPSLFEGLPVTLIEAQASGLPCIISDSISKESHITDLVTDVPLEESFDYWANEVLNYRGNKRINTYEKIKECGYDIKSEAKRLQELYLEYWSKCKVVD